MIFISEQLKSFGLDNKGKHIMAWPTDPISPNPPSSPNPQTLYSNAGLVGGLLNPNPQTGQLSASVDYSKFDVNSVPQTVLPHPLTNYVWK